MLREYHTYAKVTVNRSSPPRWEASGQPRPRTGSHCAGISHPGTGVDDSCNQAIPTTDLPLLRQRIKRRDERHFIRHRCRLKILATATSKHRLWKRGGSNARLDVFELEDVVFLFLFFLLQECITVHPDGEPRCTTIQQPIHNKQANRTTPAKPSTRPPQTSQHPKRVKTQRGRYIYSYGRVRRHTPGCGRRIAQLHNKHYGRTLSRPPSRSMAPPPPYRERVDSQTRGGVVIA